MYLPCDRLKLAVLVILAGVIGFMSGIVGTLFDIANSAIVGELIVNTINNILFILLYGMIDTAYWQVQGDNPERVATSGVSESLDSIGS